MEFKICKCGCGRLVPLTRADRAYFSKDCRNRVSNARRAEKIEHDTNQTESRSDQEITLRHLYGDGQREVLIEEGYFSKWDVRPEMAFEQIHDEQGNLFELRFRGFSLIRVNQSFFRLKKINQ